MKNILVLGFAFLLSLSLFAEKKLIESTITEVTVYPVGAMVNREATVNMRPGTHLIVLDNLTSSIDPNTIQVGGRGDFEILSVKMEIFYPYQKNKPKGIKVLEDSLKMYQDQNYLLVAQNAALDEERAMILANKKLSNDKGNVTVAELQAMAKYYRLQLNEIGGEKLKNSNVRIEVAIQVKRLKATLAGMNQYKYEKVGRIVVETKARVNTQAKFKFSYFTHLASWQPKYNIKAVSDGDHIDVHYHAMVSQTTGVDWKDLDLILSTSRPTFNNQKPELHPWYLDYIRKNKGMRARSMVVSSDLNEEMADAPAANMVYSEGLYVALDKKASYSSAKTVINALNTAYKINNKYTVLSNNSQKQVFIKQVEIPALFNHFAVPSMEKEAFLTASIADWAGYDLVPGNATLFYNNTYVGRSYIYSNTTDDTLQISLGRDRGIVLTHKKLKELSTTKKIGANIKKNFVYEVTAKNTNKEAISIVIQDRIPVSRRADIVVSEGELQGAEWNEDTGILKWTKTIAPGQTIKLTFDYEVKFPKDKAINI